MLLQSSALLFRCHPCDGNNKARVSLGSPHSAADGAAAAAAALFTGSSTSSKVNLYVAIASKQERERERKREKARQTCNEINRHAVLAKDRGKREPAREGKNEQIGTEFRTNFS